MANNMTKTRRVLCIVPVALIACGAVWLFLGIVYPPFRAIYLSLGPKPPTFQGRNMVQWLQILRTNTNSTGDPLSSAHISCDKRSKFVTAEVPLSYDLLMKYDFCGRDGGFDLIVNGRYLPAGCQRATNGNCLLKSYARELNPGTNQVQVAFFISNQSDKDHFLSARSTVTEVIPTEAIPSP